MPKRSRIDVEHIGTDFSPAASIDGRPEDGLLVLRLQ